MSIIATANVRNKCTLQISKWAKNVSPIFFVYSVNDTKRIGI